MIILVFSKVNLAAICDRFPMPVTSIQIQYIISVVVVLLAWLYFDADDKKKLAFVDDNSRSQAIGNVPAREIYSNYTVLCILNIIPVSMNNYFFLSCLIN